jgi:hypothetical protein
VTRSSTLTLNIIPTELKYTVRFKQRLLPHCWPYGLGSHRVDGEDRLICHPARCCQGHRESAKKSVQLFYSCSTYVYFGYIGTSILEEPLRLKTAGSAEMLAPICKIMACSWQWTIFLTYGHLVYHYCSFPCEVLNDEEFGLTLWTALCVARC